MINVKLVIFLSIYGVQGSSDVTTIAQPSEFNYFVMVWNYDKFQCGGTIIDQRHIITRGSCVLNIPRSNLSIVAREISMEVESVHIHYGFKATDDVVMLGEIHWLHDIAILKLVNRMIWDSFTAPAVLIPGEYNWNLAVKCVVPGWRHTFIGTKREHYYIRWTVANIHADVQGTPYDVRLLEHEKWASWPPLTSKWTGTMHYYSSSPIVCENAVIGIVDGRKRGKFHVFLNLLPYKDFIENAIDDRKYDVNPGEISYVVSIWYEGRFKCGGIIFDALHILTTGDCVQYANHTNLQVIAGHTQVLGNDPRIQWLSVNNIEMHRDYEEIMHFEGPKFMHIKNNYAILTLAVPLECGPTIGPAFLSNTEFVPTNDICRAYRWHNAYTVDDKVLLQLVWSQEVIMNEEVCRDEGVHLEADEVCANGQYAQHPGNPDSSGNPVVCDGFVIGMIVPDYSNIPQCSGFTSILRISPFMNFVNDECYIHPI